jgi:hypothetical protein
MQPAGVPRQVWGRYQVRFHRQYCAVRTRLCLESSNQPHLFLSLLSYRRAYKLGKKRWSYNQISVNLKEAGGSRELSIHHAKHSGQEASLFGAEAANSAVAFQLHLENDRHVNAHTFLCYDEPEAIVNVLKNEEGGRPREYKW